MVVGTWLKWPWGKADAVRNDWVACLPQAKKLLFDSVARELESSYFMLGIALSDAMDLRAEGTLIRARQQVRVAAQLSTLLAQRLVETLHVLEQHGHHHCILPSVAPLEAGFFRSPEAQALARWKGLLQRTVLGDRQRFFHKLHALARLVENLAEEFRSTGEEIAEGLSIRPDSHWKALDDLHYDLNTCLRETIVVWKSFLRAVPDEHLEDLRHRLVAQPAIGAGAFLPVSRAWQ